MVLFLENMIDSTIPKYQFNHKLFVILNVIRENQSFYNLSNNQALSTSVFYMLAQEI